MFVICEIVRIAFEPAVASPFWRLASARCELGSFEFASIQSLGCWGGDLGDDRRRPVATLPS